MFDVTKIHRIYYKKKNLIINVERIHYQRKILLKIMETALIGG